MARFPVAFNRRKSTADNLDNAVAGPSFRVLDRAEVVSGHGHSYSTSNGNNSINANGNGSAAARFAVKSQSMPNNLDDDNLFADLNNTNRYESPVYAEPREQEPEQKESEPKNNKWFKRRTDTNLFNGSGSANTTNTNSTDNSSRHSNVSTAPSSNDLNAQQQQQQQQQQPQYHSYQPQEEEHRVQSKKKYGDVPVPPIPKSSTTSSFLKSAGRTLSFGGNKKHIPVLPNDGNPPQTPTDGPSRDRSMTTSTVTTATPPKIDEEFTLDLGGDFSKMLGNFDSKRASVATLRMGQQINGDRNGGDADRPALVPRSLTGNRLNQPAPIQVDHSAKIEPSPYSWSSQNSNDKLMYSHNLAASANENAPPPVPRHASPLALGESATSPTLTDSGLKRSSAIFGRRRSATTDYNTPAAEAEDEDTVLLKDSLFSVNRFLAGSNLSLSNDKPSSSPSSRFGRRNNDTLDTGYSKVPTESTSPTFGAKAVADEDDNLFDSSMINRSRVTQSYTTRKPSPPRNKVMTPAQFERYRKDKEREGASKTIGIDAAASKNTNGNNSDSDDDDKYEDDIDEAEKSRQAAKQRRKQEAHMAVYRQQMMKVTGESNSGGPAARSSMYFSMSTPNLPSLAGHSPQNGSEAGANEDEDEEVPLAILAAHGFPNRNRPPTRLSTMMSNPNLRAAAAPSYQRPQSVMGDGQQQAPPQSAANGGRLPVFARNLPQDPYGLVNNNQRETLNFAGGAPAPAGGLPPGGLVGVIASEERSRAMRRGSPALDAVPKPLPNMSGANPNYDPMAGIPSQMMYPGVGAGMGGQMPMMSAADQAQIQMTQQMQQFMQMQMQFMQMMANGGANSQRPMSQYGGQGGMGMGLNGMRGMPGMNMNGMLGMNGMGGEGSVRHSFVDNGSMLDVQLPRPDMHTRTMSMVQPSSASWIQPLQQHMGGNYAPSIRVQGAGNGYTPSIAPSERSNVGLPGRYRPVSHMPAAVGGTSPSLEPSLGPTSGASSPGWDISRKHKSPSPLQKEAITIVASAVDDDDDEEGWAAMKAKREKKRSMWKSKKTLSSELGALIS